MTTKDRLKLALSFALAAHLVGCAVPVAGPAGGGGPSTGKADGERESTADSAEFDIPAHDPDELERQLAAAATPAVRAAADAYLSTADGWTGWSVQDIAEDLTCYLQSRRLMRSHDEIDVVWDDEAREVRVSVHLAEGSFEPTTWTFDCRGESCELASPVPTGQACLPSQSERELGCKQAPQLLEKLRDFGAAETQGYLIGSDRPYTRHIPTKEEFANAVGVEVDRVKHFDLAQAYRATMVVNTRTLFNYGVDFDGDGWDYTTISGVYEDEEEEPYLYHPFVSGGAWTRDTGFDWSSRRFAKYRWQCEGFEGYADPQPEPEGKLTTRDTKPPFDCDPDIDYPELPAACPGS
jgi:hypothetical protein